MACRRCNKHGHNARRCPVHMAVRKAPTGRPRKTPEQLAEDLEATYPGIVQLMGSASPAVVAQTYGISRQRVSVLRSRIQPKETKMTLYLMIPTAQGFTPMRCATIRQQNKCAAYLKKNGIVSRPVYRGSLDEPTAGTLIGHLYADGAPEPVSPVSGLVTEE